MLWIILLVALCPAIVLGAERVAVRIPVERGR
jgi:hypothetical protein